MIAEAAVKYVQSVVTFGADNKIDDLAHRIFYDCEPGETIKSIREKRHTGERALHGVDALEWAQDIRSKRNFRYLMHCAVDAMASGQGRCDEQAALALYYLVKKKKYKNIGVFDMSKANAPLGDEFKHRFVLLGLEKTPSQIGIISLSHCPVEWMNAVWCDPWAHQWFEIKDGWPRHLNNIACLLPDREGIKGSGIQIVCRYYYDGEESLEDWFDDFLATGGAVI